MKNIWLSAVVGAATLLGLPGLSSAQHGVQHGRGGSFGHGAVHNWNHAGHGTVHGWYNPSHHYYGGHNHYGHSGVGLFLGSSSYLPRYNAYPYYGSSYYYEPTYSYVQPTYSYAQPTIVAPETYAPLNLGSTVTPAEDVVTSVTVDVVVPAAAEVWFDGYKTNQTGSTREFVSPALEPGRTFTYDVRARWTDATGRVVDETKQVPVKAGQQVTINFMAR